MLNDKLLKMLNDQMNFEIYSGYIYLSMAAYCDSIDLNGFANWLKVQVQEEMAHALKMYNYITERGGKAEFDSVPKPQTSWESILDVFEDALAHERIVTERINKLMDSAIELSDHALRSFLNWFVDEQVEEEANVDKLIKQLKLIGNSGHGIFMIDKEMAARTFTMPVGVTI